MRVLMYAPATIHAETLPLTRTLQESGFHLDTCSSLERLIYLSMTEKYAAVICKGLESQVTILETFSRWKAEGCTSLFIVVTSATSWMQRAKALEAGVNHYFIKPFSHIQLISVVLKHAYEASLHENHSFKTNYFELDLLRRTAKALGSNLSLTKTEFDLLALLIRRRGIVLSRVQIWEDVWGYEDYPLANTVDVHMNRLRKKLPEAAKPLIGTVYGIGYRLQSDA